MSHSLIIPKHRLCSVHYPRLDRDLIRVFTEKRQGEPERGALRRALNPVFFLSGFMKTLSQMGGNGP